MLETFRITFPNVSHAERSILAADLRDRLAEIKGVSSASLEREGPDTQDASTIISIVLRAPAVVLAVKTIGTWLVRNNHVSVDIDTPAGKTVLRNMRSQDVEVLERWMNGVGWRG